MKTDAAKSTSVTQPAWTWRFSGLVSTGGTGMPASNEGPIEVMIMAIVGGFVGLLLGFILAQVGRCITMFVGVSIGAPSWGAYGAIAGALAFALIALVGGE